MNKCTRRLSAARSLGTVCLVVLFSLGAFSGETFGASDTEVRPSALAGTWYPANRPDLRAMVRNFLEKAPTNSAMGKIIGIAVPHAGLIYSGGVAAHAYRVLQGKPIETLVIIGPSHRMSFPGAAIDIRTYETPLGQVKVDQELAEAIVRAGPAVISKNKKPHDVEHCIEIQLPFLQTVLPKSRIVPILMGTHDYETSRSAASALAKAIRGRKVLLIASTDLSHFHDGDSARTMDGRLIDRVRSFDDPGLAMAIANGTSEACGSAALLAVMLAAKELGATHADVLSYAHSGDVTGDNTRVIGYMAAAFGLPGSKTAMTESGRHSAGVDVGLGTPEQIELLKIAREAISAALADRTYKPGNFPEKLKEHRGAFVTIKQNGELRGCIGRLVSDEPLAQVVADMAVEAALRDPRFPPVAMSELVGLRLEISALTPFELVQNVESIEVGVHGLMVVRNRRQGLLLPQVAVEQGWNRDVFLANTCLKAGLPPDAWRDEETAIYRFSAQVFGEDDLKGSMP